MIRLKKHITVLLIGLFFFPVVFQSIHMVWHQSHSSSCGHHECDHKPLAKNSHPFAEKCIKNNENCPVCLYQFSINNVTKLSHLNFQIIVITCNYKAVAIAQQNLQVFADKSPRAPPVFIS